MSDRENGLANHKSSEPKGKEKADVQATSEVSTGAEYDGGPNWQFSLRDEDSIYVAEIPMFVLCNDKPCRHTVTIQPLAVTEKPYNTYAGRLSEEMKLFRTMS